MINYDPKQWFIFIFKFSKADTFRKLFPLMLAISVYSGLIAFVELNYLKLADSRYLSNIGMMHSVLGFVISLLLVFRTNTAYDRWWEGRKIWGSLTNSSRYMAMKVAAFLNEEEDKLFFLKIIPNYAYALKNHLREHEKFEELHYTHDFNADKHLPNQIALAMYTKINSKHISGQLTTAQMLALNEDIKSFTDICGASERIKNTPIPFTYSVFIKKFIFFFVMTLPFGWVFSLGYFVIPVVVLILYAFASLELIAEEIENPFGLDSNDLPLDQICHNIRKHVTELLD